MEKDSLEKSGLDLLRVICSAALDKKAKDINILYVKDLFKIADYFFICSADSTVQVGAITENILEKTHRLGIRQIGIEGNRYNQWVLLDFDNVIIHIFYKSVRTFYDLDGLWKDAPKVKLEELEKFNNEAKTSDFST
ncbi:MAG TPA: ribosome silencing factor [bacterium]